MSDRTVYVIGLNKMYLTNKTNVTRLWEVIERELGKENLEISYKKNEDEEYIVTPARVYKIKQLCNDAYRNRILVHSTGARDENCISIQQDILGGKD